MDEHTESEILIRLDSGQSSNPVDDVQAFINILRGESVNALKKEKQPQQITERLVELIKICTTDRFLKKYGEPNSTNILSIISNARSTLAELGSTIPRVDKEILEYTKAIIQKLLNNPTFLQGLRDIPPENCSKLFEYIGVKIHIQTTIKEKIELPVGCDLDMLIMFVIIVLGEDGLISKAQYSQYLSWSPETDL
jgi:hypothetical protein